MQDSFVDRMNTTEIRATAGLSLVFAFRMLGMFMVLPVLATYGLELQGATPALIGLAIGAYGLTQAIFQIPCGILSDRIGRLPIIYAGLIIFALGAVVSACSESIWGVIAGRILQGAGAISAAIMALLSDLTREQHRTRAMAAMGLSIGLSFAAAMILGPLLTHAFGLSGLFWATMLMALLGLIIIRFMPKTQKHEHRETLINRELLGKTLKNPDLLRINLGIFALHAVLMASFVALPLALVEQGGLSREHHWLVYLGTLVLGFISMVPFIIYGEKKRQMKRVLLGAISLLLFCEVFFWLFAHSLWLLIFGMLLFFTTFNLLEASLPSLISKVSPAGSKGTAMGIYATSQFLGAALGGILGGWLYQQSGAEAVFLLCTGVSAFWLYQARSMTEPPYVTSARFELPEQQTNLQNISVQLLSLPGVTEVSIVEQESALYVKFDSHQVSWSQLQATLHRS